MKKFDPRYDLEITALDVIVWKTMKYSEWRTLRNRCLLASLIQSVIGLILLPFVSLWSVSFLFIGAGFLALLRAAAVMGALLWNSSPEEFQKFCESKKKRR